MFYSKFSERCPISCLGIETTPPSFIKKLQKFHLALIPTPHLLNLFILFSEKFLLIKWKNEWYQSNGVRAKNTLQFLINKTNMLNVRFAHSTCEPPNFHFFISLLNLFNVANVQDQVPYLRSPARNSFLSKILLFVCVKILMLECF